MTIRECYKLFDGDFEDVLSRLIDDARIEKFSLRFLDVTEYNELIEAMAKQDWNNAFLAAHTLKGVSLNLGFSRLAKIDAELTEVLRPRQVDDVAHANQLLEQVTVEYNKVCDALRAFIAAK